jgi:hypothetical protein
MLDLGGLIHFVPGRLRFRPQRKQKADAVTHLAEVLTASAYCHNEPPAARAALHLVIRRLRL